MTDISIRCHQVVDEGLAEQYVAGRLTGEVREAFEQHYMECASCFDRLTRLHAVRAHLETHSKAPGRTAIASTWPRRWRLAAAASVVAGLSLAGWMLLRSAVSGEPPTVARAPVPAPVTSGQNSVDVATMARFEPPPYRPSALRGPESDAVVEFRAAMEHYQRRDFSGAIPGLRRAAASRADAAFFLAACQLLTDDAVGAVGSARSAVAFGDTPYLEDSRLLLAKALLLVNDRAGARRELEAVVAMEGERRDEAAALARRIEDLP